MQKKTIHAAVLSGIALIFLSLAGCATSGNNAVAEQKTSVDEQIKKLESDQSMPPQVKQSVIASLRAKQQGGTPAAK